MRRRPVDHGERGIRINAVAAGPIESGPIESGPVMGQPEAVRERAGGSGPMHRTGTADEVAAAVERLALDAGYVTGTVLAVDGAKAAGGA